jgi:hypothetical protein
LQNWKKHKKKYELRKRVKVVNYRESSSDDSMIKKSNNAEIMNIKGKKEETIIHLMESEEENEGSISQGKIEGKNKEAMQEKRVLIKSLIKKEKSKKKMKCFRQIRERAQKTTEEEKNASPKGKRLENFFQVNKNKNEILKNNKGDLQFVIKIMKLNLI